MSKKKEVVQRVRYRLYVRKVGDSRRQEFRDEKAYNTVTELFAKYGEWLDKHALTHDWRVNKEFYWE